MSKNVPQEIFGEVAELYDKARPDYPQQAVDDVIEWADLRQGDRLLEIGCGTGIATRAFAPFGFAMTCIDPAPGMLEVARRNCAEYPEAAFVEARFEEWPSDGPYGLVYSAQAFHWIDPEIGPSRVAEALQDGGAFALLRHHQERPDTELRWQIDAAYAEFAPDLRTPAPGAHSITSWWDVVANSGLFTDLEKREYPWVAEYSADSWIRLLKTYSDHRALPDDRRKRLHTAVHEAIEKHGGVHRFQTVTEVILAHKVG